jgi:hypothetical protein
MSIFGEGGGAEQSKKLANGWRPEIPGDVVPWVREMISGCWESEASHRPSFREVWAKLVEFEFMIVGDVDSWVVKEVCKDIPGFEYEVSFSGVKQ